MICREFFPVLIFVGLIFRKMDRNVLVSGNKSVEEETFIHNEELSDLYRSDVSFRLG
jgi:hypothetical protein